VPQLKPLGPRSIVEGGEGLFDDGCTTWESVGFWGDGDDFTFKVVDDKVVSVTNLALTDLGRAEYDRVAEKKD
jgi:hypothetical protein